MPPKCDPRLLKSKSSDGYFSVASLLNNIEKTDSRLLGWPTAKSNISNASYAHSPKMNSFLQVPLAQPLPFMDALPMMQYSYGHERKKGQFFHVLKYTKSLGQLIEPTEYFDIRRRYKGGRKHLRQKRLRSISDVYLRYTTSQMKRSLRSYDGAGQSSLLLPGTARSQLFSGPGHRRLTSKSSIYKSKTPEMRIVKRYTIPLQKPAVKNTSKVMSDKEFVDSIKKMLDHNSFKKKKVRKSSYKKGIVSKNPINSLSKSKKLRRQHKTYQGRIRGPLDRQRINYSKEIDKKNPFLHMPQSKMKKQSRKSNYLIETSPSTHQVRKHNKENVSSKVQHWPKHKEYERYHKSNNVRVKHGSSQQRREHDIDNVSSTQVQHWPRNKEYEPYHKSSNVRVKHGSAQQRREHDIKNVSSTQVQHWPRNKEYERYHKRMKHGPADRRRELYKNNAANSYTDLMPRAQQSSQHHKKSSLRMQKSSSEQVRHYNMDKMSSTQFQDMPRPIDHARRRKTYSVRIKNMSTEPMGKYMQGNIGVNLIYHLPEGKIKGIKHKSDDMLISPSVAQIEREPTIRDNSKKKHNVGKRMRRRLIRNYVKEKPITTPHSSAKSSTKSSWRDSYRKSPRKISRSRRISKDSRDSDKSVDSVDFKHMAKLSKFNLHAPKRRRSFDSFRSILSYRRSVIKHKASIKFTARDRAKLSMDAKKIPDTKRSSEGNVSMLSSRKSNPYSELSSTFAFNPLLSYGKNDLINRSRIIRDRKTLDMFRNLPDTQSIGFVSPYAESLKSDLQPIESREKRLLTNRKIKNSLRQLDMVRQSASDGSLSYLSRYRKVGHYFEFDLELSYLDNISIDDINLHDFLFYPYNNKVQVEQKKAKHSISDSRLTKQEKLKRNKPIETETTKPPKKCDCPICIAINRNKPIEDSPWMVKMQQELKRQELLAYMKKRQVLNLDCDKPLDFPRNVLVPCQKPSSTCLQISPSIFYGSNN